MPAGQRRRFELREPRRESTKVKPFLKWAGGKGRVLKLLTPLLPPDVKNLRYIEPFVGGGAMFFHLEPETSILNDINAKLMACYRQVRDNLQGVLELLEPMTAEHSEERYLMRRDWFNRSTVGYSANAALFIYLNKTCFNGLYRENKNGKFNVPSGKYEKPEVYDAEHLKHCSTLLSRAELECGSFIGAMKWAGKGDFVYLDPPYDPVSEEQHFTSYHESGFGKKDQHDLYVAAVQASARGAKVMISNADTEYVRTLYDEFKINSISESRSVSCNGKKRQKVGALVITNY